MKRFHLWEDAPDWSADPEKNRALFVGAYDTVDEVADGVAKFMKEFEARQTYEYYIVTLGDMSPASLAANGGEDPDDIWVADIGEYSAKEAEKLWDDWHKEYSEYLDKGCWITSASVLCEPELSLWDGKQWCWIHSHQTTREQIIERFSDSWDYHRLNRHHVENNWEPCPYPIPITEESD